MMAIVGASMQAAAPLARSSGGNVGTWSNGSVGIELAEPPAPHPARERARAVAASATKARRNGAAARAFMWSSIGQAWARSAFERRNQLARTLATVSRP